VLSSRETGGKSRQGKENKEEKIKNKINKKMVEKEKNMDSGKEQKKKRGRG